MRQIVILLIIATVLSGCARNSPAPPGTCPTLPPLPASVMQPPGADFNQQMSNFLFDTDETQKAPASN